MNLISGYLVHRRNKEIVMNLNTNQLQHQMQLKGSGIGIFLFIYCAPCALLLMAVIYEFANIDVWLNAPVFVSATEKASTPLWPFLTRAFMEITLGIICSAWVLGPKISMMYKQQLTPHSAKASAVTSTSTHGGQPSSRSSHVAYSTASYQTVRQVPHLQTQTHPASALSLNHVPSHSWSRKKSAPHIYVNRDYKINQSLHRHGNETIL